MKNILSNIRAFKRKYYFDQIIKSLLWFIVIWGSYYLIISILEYFLWLSPTIRTTLMYIMIGFSLLTLVLYIFIPLLRSWGIVAPISDDAAARDIGRSMPSVQDRLLNYLQLKQKADEEPSNPWYQKGAMQKERSLSKYNFSDAINIKSNTRRASRYLMVVVGVVILILIVYPALLTDSAERIWNPTKVFEPEAPFDFLVDESKLMAIAGDPYDVRVQLKGDAIPESLDILIDDKTYEMQPIDDNIFIYHIDRLEQGFEFQFESAPYHSKKWKVKTIEKIDINNLKLYIDYPSYLTSLKDHWAQSVGDIEVPYGTKLSWSIQAPGLQNVVAKIGHRTEFFTKMPTGFMYALMPKTDTTISFSYQQQYLDITDTLRTHITVRADQFPTLSVQQRVDSSDPGFVVLTGEAADDHGLTSVNLVMHVLSSSGGTIATYTTPLPKDKKNYTSFTRLIDFYKYKIPAGARVQYYIRATDNDVTRGGKSVKSQIFEYKKPSAKEQEKIQEENSKEAIDALSQGQSNSEKSQKLIEEAKRDLLSKRTNSYENKQAFEQLRKQNLQIQKNLEDFTEKLQKSQEYHKDLKNEYLKEKEEELEKAADDVLQNQIDKQLERIQKLMEKLQKNEATVQEMQEMQEQQSNIENELERLEELAKRLEMQVKMDQLSDKVDSAAVEELRLSMEIQKNQKDNNQLQQKREKQNQMMDEISKEMQELNQENKDLESPFKMDNANDELQSAKANQQRSDQSRSSSGNMSKSSQQSKDANQNLMNLAQKLQDMANDQDMDEMQEDIAAMRRLLQNLMKISFNQEALLKSTKSLKSNSPKFPDLAKKQGEIKMQVKLIEDSLARLANKDLAKGGQMNEELQALLTGLDQSLEEFEAYRQDLVIRTQQYNMMHVNNLALYFGEGLNSMMAQANAKKQAQKKGSGKCKRPGGKKPGSKPGGPPSSQMRDIITQQQKLGNSMQQMQNALNRRKGQQGKPQPSDQGKNSPEGKAQRQAEAEQIARMAKEQSDLRERIKALNAELKKQGVNIPELNDLAKKQDQNETQIINKQIDSKLLARQQEIITQMLKSEEAIREQEQGEKREAEKAVSKFTRSVPPSLVPFLHQHIRNQEKYQTIPPDMETYYKEMTQKYFKTLQ